MPWVYGLQFMGGIYCHEARVLTTIPKDQYRCRNIEGKYTIGGFKDQLKVPGLYYIGKRMT